ncbi:MAG: hypothetical protein ACREFN_08790, partial [Acetobacteraceae bacterium]
LLRAPLWLATLVGGQPGTLASAAGVLLVGLVGLAFAAGTVRVGRVPSTARAGGWRGWLPRYSQPTAQNEVADITGYLWALCTMVLVAPVSWEHSYTWLLPAILLGFGAVLLLGAGGRRRDALLLALLAAGYALTTADFPLGFDHTDQFILTPSVLGVPLRPVFMLIRPLGALLIWLVMGWLFLRASRAAPTGVASADAEAPVLPPRRLAVVLGGLLGAVVLVRGVIIALMVAFGAAYGPTALLR